MHREAEGGRALLVSVRRIERPQAGDIVCGKPRDVRDVAARREPFGPAAGSSVATRPIALPGVELMTAFSCGE
jgi:hypothetical protein